MNKKLITEIKNLNADIKQGKKEENIKKNLIENMTDEMTMENKFIDIKDPNTYNNYKLLTNDKKMARDSLLTSFIETNKKSDISVQFQLNRERIRAFAKNYGGKMVKIINGGASDGNLYYITNFGDAIKKFGGMNNLSKSCNTVPIEINFEYVENYKYNKYTGNYLISTSNGKASTSTDATIIKVLDHTMTEFHPCGMEDSFVYVGLNKNDYRHGLKNTNPNTKDKYIGCYHDTIRHGPKTIIENVTAKRCGEIASELNSKYASAKVGKFSFSEMIAKGVNDYAYNKNGINFYGIKNASVQSDGQTKGQCVLLAAKLDESYKYTKWRSQPEYLGCWGDWFDNPWGLSPRTRAMTRVNSSSLLTFESCKNTCKGKGFNIWGLQYASGRPSRGECYCSYEWKKNIWQKYGGADNCTRDPISKHQVGGSWSNAVYKDSVNPRPQDNCLSGGRGGQGNIVAFYEAEKFREDNLGKNAYIDRESISHDLSKTNSSRIFYSNDTETKNTNNKGCNISYGKHNEITSKEWSALRTNTGKNMTCNEKQTDHDYNMLQRATDNLVNISKFVQNKNEDINENIMDKQRQILQDADRISQDTEAARTILNAIKMPNISGFNNPKNNLNSITNMFNTNMFNNIVNKITGKTKIIEGHENDCHGDGTTNCGIPVQSEPTGHNRDHHGADGEYQKAKDAKDREIQNILETIRKYFVSAPTFEAQREFTLLDVESKKQWLYIWAFLIMSIVSLKFYIMAKK